MERIQKNLGVPWRTPTVDTLKAGGPDTSVLGIATTMMATFDVVQRAAKAGRNFVITHEPTFYNHEDTTSAFASDPVYAAKRAFLETSRSGVRRRRTRMQFQPQGKPSPGIVFDADLGNTIDDALALAMLFGFQGKNESRVISVSTTKSSLDAAIFADVLVRFYTGEPGPFAPAIPIGLSLSGKMTEPNAMLTAVIGNPKYARTIVKMNDTADPLALIRNALSAQFDQNAVVVLTGPATNLAGLLALPGTAQLIAQKVHMLVVAADAITLSDVPATRRVFAEWPTPIVVAPSEPRRRTALFRRRIDKDFAWSEAHPAGGRLSRLPPDALRCACCRHGGRPLRRAPAGELLQGLRPGHGQRRRRREHPPGAGARRQASYADRRRRAERSNPADLR